MKYRNLKEEIIYHRENYFNHNAIDLNDLLMWYGEQKIIEDENKLLQEKINKLKYANNDLLNTIVKLQEENFELANK